MELEITPEDILIFTHNQPFIKKYGELTIIHAETMLKNIKNGADENNFTIEENKELVRLIKAYKEIWGSIANLSNIQREFFPNCVVCSKGSSGLWGLGNGLTISMCYEHSCEWTIIRKQHTKFIEGDWYNSKVNAEISRDIVKTLLERNGVVIPGVVNASTTDIKNDSGPNITKSAENVVIEEKKYSNYNYVHEQFIQCALEELNRSYFRKWN